MLQKNRKKVAKKFHCEKCDYYSNNRYDYNKHLQTKKHNATECYIDATSKIAYTCSCGKTYKHHTSYYRHKSVCETGFGEEIVAENVIETPVKNEKIESDKNETLATLLMELIDTNKDLKEQIIDLANKPRTVNNNSFNLNNFLNIQCRDAMNLSEFLEQLQITFQDLLYLGNHGFVESFKDTFIKQLKTLDQTKRPIHCTDQKRKAVVVKENDKWEKENTHEIIHEAIDKVNRKQINAFSQHAKNRDKDFLADDINLENNSKIIIEMCGYNQKTADAIHKKIMKHLAETSSINKYIA